VGFTFLNFQIKVFKSDLADNTTVTEFAGHQSYINSVAFEPDGNLLASASDDLTCRVWNIKEVSGRNEEFKVDLESPGI